MAQTAPPPLRFLLREASLPFQWLRGRSAAPQLAAQWPGDGRAVLVIPGFGNLDSHTALLRDTLDKAGYRSFPWGLGAGGPVRPDLFDRLDRRLAAILDRTQGPVTLLGWSLGGVIARGYAHHAPDKVAAVITLGSPFSGDPRSNRAWRLYEALADHPVDRPPIGANYAAKPPAHTTAIWSPHDGIVPRAAAEGQPDERDAAIAIRCGHFAMSCAPDALQAVLQALRMPAPPAR